MQRVCVCVSVSIQDFKILAVIPGFSIQPYLIKEPLINKVGI